MATEDFRIRSERGEMQLLLILHPERVGNLEGKHGRRDDEDERLTGAGQWQAMNVGFCLGQYAVMERLGGGSNPDPRYRFDVASATQGRCQEATIRARRAAHAVMRSMAELGLGHSIVIPNWDSVHAPSVAGMTEAEIAQRYPRFAYEWLLWRQGERELPPELPGPDDEAPESFAKRIISGLRLAIHHSRTRTLAVFVTHSVMQLSRCVLQGYNPLVKMPYLDASHGWVEPWTLYEDQPPKSLTNGFVSPARLAVIYAQRFGVPPLPAPPR